MKRPLAYITAAWCGSDHENTKLAAQYCRTVYRALGNAIALPCAEYIMAGIAEALTKGGANDGI